MAYKDPTNDDRASWAAAALGAFARVTNMDTAGEDNSTILNDLLADLMHLCERDCIDFESVLTNARATFAEEKAEEAESEMCTDCGAQVASVLGCPDGAEVCPGCEHRH